MSSLAFRLMGEFVIIRGIILLEKWWAGSRLGIPVHIMPHLSCKNAQTLLRDFLFASAESVCSSGRSSEYHWGGQVGGGRVSRGERKGKRRNKKRSQR